MPTVSVEAHLVDRSVWHGCLAAGITLATTAIGDHFLGDRMPLSRGLLGLALVWLGVLLCTQ